MGMTNIYRTAPSLEVLIRAPRSFSKKVIKPAELQLKILKSVEKRTGKNRYRSKKFLRQQQRQLEEDREWVNFKVYQEETLFTPEMMQLE
jgi:hypothetical protein